MLYIINDSITTHIYYSKYWHYVTEITAINNKKLKVFSMQVSVPKTVKINDELHTTDMKYGYFLIYLFLLLYASS